MVTMHYLKVIPTTTIKLLREKPDAHPAHIAQLFSKPLLLTDYLIVERGNPLRPSKVGLYRNVSLSRYLVARNIYDYYV